MHRTAAFLLLTLFLCQLLAWRLVPLAGLARVRKLSFSEMEASKTEHVVFRFSKIDFQKKRFDRHEFLHDGVIYDFEKTQNLSSDSVLVTAHPDFREQQFFEKMGKMFSPKNQNSTDSSPFSKQLARFLGEHFLLPRDFSEFYSSKHDFQKPSFHFLEMLKSIDRKIFDPPPDVV